MADFNTHLMGAAAVSGLAATVLVMTGQFPHQAVIGYFVLGVIGGLLPDLDSPTSIPIRIAFAVVAVVAGFLVVFTFGRRYSLVELDILWFGCFLFIRYGLFNLFDRVTAHRGLIHSIPAGIGFGLFALGCWTWYPIRNSRWLRARGAGLSRAWATAQGLAVASTVAMAAPIKRYLLCIRWPIGAQVRPCE